MHISAAIGDELSLELLHAASANIVLNDKVMPAARLLKSSAPLSDFICRLAACGRAAHSE